MLSDLKYATRALLKAPAFTVTAIFTLALGIGANTAVFSIFNAVILKPAPFPEPDRLVLLTYAGKPFEPVLTYTSAPKFWHWRAQTGVIEDVAAYRTISLNLTEGDALERVTASQVSLDYFHAFRAPIALGRTYLAREDTPGAARTVVISHAFWIRHFAQDPNVIGRVLSLSGNPYTIIGVTAPGFDTRELGPIDMWVPFQLDPATTDRNEYLQVVARLKPGVTLEQAQQKLAASAAVFAERNADIMRGVSFSAVPFEAGSIGSQARLELYVLIGAVGFVLLIACANVANLLLIRALGRQHEVAIRIALGAKRWQIARQLLAESTLLAVVSSLLGLVIGCTAIRMLLAVDTAGLPRLGEHGTLLTLDWRVVAFTVTLAAVTSILFSLAPALIASRADVEAVIKQSGDRFTSGRRQNHLRSMLVIAEVGLAVVLLVGAALLVRTSIALNTINPGFTVNNVLVMRTSLAEQRFESLSAVRDLSTTTLERIRAIPGVAAATASVSVPLQSSFGDVFNVVGRDNGNQPVTGGGDTVITTGGYFSTFEIPLLRGRLFNEHDDSGSSPVVVINHRMATRYWPNGEDPLHSQIKLPFDPTPRQIIGIVDDVRALRLSLDPRPIMYLPLTQTAEKRLHFQLSNEPLAWIVRTNVNPATLAQQIQSEIRHVTRTPVTDVAPMTQILSASIATQRLNMMLMTILGGIALLLAAVGIYGLVAFSVQQRTHEIGIRMALGARATQVGAMVLRQGTLLVGTGVTVGLGAAFLLSNLLASILFGVVPHDAVVFTTVLMVLALVGITAVLVPAHRASHVDPLLALRVQ